MPILHIGLPLLPIQPAPPPTMSTEPLRQLAAQDATRGVSSRHPESPAFVERGASGTGAAPPPTPSAGR
jgi:hypothetical protein